jgi:tryptophanyl-tRNA synthetase
MPNQYLGKDQLQHLEITRDVASRFNHQMEKLSSSRKQKIQEDNMLIPGTNGGKMSKSANNIINIFLDDKALRKQVMSIETDSTLEEPKTQTAAIRLPSIKLLANEEQLAAMTANYLEETTVSTALFELITQTFKTERKYNYYMSNLPEVDALLKIGANKAATVANAVLSRVREKLGFEI